MLVEPRGFLIDLTELEVSAHPFWVTPRHRDRSVVIVARPDQQAAVEPLGRPTFGNLDVAIQALEALVAARR